jgi:hypothetical protein
MLQLCSIYIFSVSCCLYSRTFLDRWIPASRECQFKKFFIKFSFRQLQTSSTTRTTRPRRPQRPTASYSTYLSGSRRSTSVKPSAASRTCSVEQIRPPETSTTTQDRDPVRTEKRRTNPEIIVRIKTRMTKRPA